MRGEVMWVIKMLEGEDQLMAKRVKKLLSSKGPTKIPELRRLCKLAKARDQAAQREGAEAARISFRSARRKPDLPLFRERRKYGKTKVFNQA